MLTAVVVCDHARAEPNPTILARLMSDAPTELERLQVATAIEKCRRKPRVDQVDVELMVALLRWEPEIGVPDRMRGILLSSWCWEASFQHKGVRGDFRNGKPTSFGPFQMQLWFTSFCNMKPKDLDDIFSAAECYWSKVEDAAGKTQCYDPIKWGQAMTANPRKYRHLGCKAASAHWREYKRWNMPLTLEEEDDTAYGQ